MKNYLVVVILFMAQLSFSQDTSSFYQTTDKQYAFKFEGGSCMLYELSKYSNYAYREWELERADHFKGQQDSLGILFSNGEYAISYDYKYFRVLKLKRGKQKDRLTFITKKLEDPSKVNEAINHPYWNALYRKTMDSVSSEYDLFQIYYRYGIDTWAPVSYKQIHPAKFELLAKEQMSKLKDSVSNVNEQLIALNEWVEKYMDELTLEDLKGNLLSRPLHEYSYDQYNSVMLESVAENRPELFFDLAEALPEEQKYLFDQINYKNAVKSLKTYKTDSPMKKEFRKFKRRQAWRIGLATTGIVTMETTVIGGAITGIVFWIRK